MTDASTGRGLTAGRLSFDDGPDPVAASRLLADWGFLANPDLPDHPGPGYLLVAIREEPTLRHYDPEGVEYWESRAGRGVRATLNLETAMPLEHEFSWGRIQVLDRLNVSNEWLTFGGHLSAALVDGMVAAAFVSPAPLLRRGGHSQGWDVGADNLGAFFGRLMVAVDYAPGFEQAAAEATPRARYAAFVADLVARFARSRALEATEQSLHQLMEHEGSHLQREHPVDWAAGLALLQASGLRGT
jgi:hypothetical protein